MIPSFELVNKILKSLPISYYLKRKANVSLSKEIEKSQKMTSNQTKEKIDKKNIIY